MDKKRHIFTKEQELFIKNNHAKYSEKELLKKFNKKFDSQITLSSLRTKKNKIGATNKINVAPVYSITKKQEKFLINNYKDKSNQDLTNLFNKKFNTNLNIFQIKHLKKKLGITQNRGNRGKPLYSERTNFDGYVEIKIKNNKTNKWQNYVLKSHYIWEQRFGKIPKDCNIIYLDGNKKNLNIKNLALVKNSELVYINHNMPFSNNKDINKTAVMIAKLMAKSKELKKEVI